MNRWYYICMLYHEIERKFLIKKMPFLLFAKSISQERYFIQRGDLVEECMQKNGTVYEYQIKMTLSKSERTREKTITTKQEFEMLKERGTRIIKRDSYTLSKKFPSISIKKYKGIYYGLELAEVEFASQEEAEEFDPYSWMGAEVTNTPLGKDATLVDLDQEHFERVLRDIQENFDFKGLGGSIL